MTGRVGPDEPVRGVDGVEGDAASDEGPERRVVERREILETELGVVLYPPTKARPYYRLVWRDIHGKRHQSGAGKDQTAAWAKAVEKNDELAAEFADPTGRTVEMLANAWLDDMGNHWSDLHGEKGESMRDRFIVPLLGAVPAASLSKEQVSATLKVPAAVSTRRHLRAAVGGMLTWGYANDWTPNPREFYLPRQPRTSKSSAGQQHGESHQYIEPRLRPSPAACKALAEKLAEAAGPKHAEQAWLMVAVSASCGVREGELWGAVTSSFDFAAGEWLVDRQVVRPKGGGVKVTAPKWGRVRKTLIPEVAIWGDPLAARLEAYLDGKGPNDLAFPAPRGGYFHPSNFSRDWLKGARAAAAPAWTSAWSWHSLRHAFCTHMLAQGALPADVAQVAGHRNAGVTQAMYVGVTAGTVSRLQDVAARKGKKAKKKRKKAGEPVVAKSEAS